jgi:hypothetical protein
MNANHSILRNAARRIGRALVLCGWLIAPCAPAGNWVTVASVPTNNLTHGIGMMLLLSDGTVMCSDSTNTSDIWFQLTPDKHGSYVNGSWSQLANATYSRLYYASGVLTNGQVFVAGGEDGSGRTHIQIYDPVTNGWTELIPPSSIYNPSIGDYFADTISSVIPNGNVLMSPALNNPAEQWEALLYNPAANSWTNTSVFAQGNQSMGECSWVKLGDGSILNVDGTVNNQTYTSERYIPALNQWIADGNLQVYLFNSVPAPKGGSIEIGPALLLPNGNAFFAGGTGYYGIYTPSGNTNAGTWACFPITNGLESADEPGATMADGNLLLVLANNCNNAGCGPPFYYYEYDYSVNPPAGAFIPEPAPTNTLGGDYVLFMLDLPDGTVLVSSGGNPQLNIYQPNGSPLAAAKPTITSITPNPDGSFHLVGTGLNGICEGAAEGDDGQMASDYPLVRLTNNATGYVSYARTYNWSTAGIRTGSTPETTEFRLPATLPYGSYSLVVVANGIASNPVAFYGPVWVDFNYFSGSGLYFGTYANPFNTLTEGTNAVASGGTIFINGGIQPSVSPETMIISKPMFIHSVFGPSTIGN